MLSSTKLATLLLLLLLHLLIAAVSVQSVVLQRLQIHNTTTTIAAEMTVTTPKLMTPPATATPKTIEILMQNSTSSQPEKDIFDKNAKIIFPSNNDSEEETKFDVYGLKTTPKPKANKIENTNTTNTSETTLFETTTIVATMPIETSNNNTTTNSTIKSLDDRLGILNLAPHCPEGHVIVNQRCHKSA